MWMQLKSQWDRCTKGNGDRALLNNVFKIRKGGGGGGPPEKEKGSLKKVRG